MKCLHAYMSMIQFTFLFVFGIMPCIVKQHTLWFIAGDICLDKYSIADIISIWSGDET